MCYLFRYFFVIYAARCHRRLWFFLLEVISKIPALSSTQHAMPPEFGGKWGTECVNTGFPLPTLQCAGYSVNLISYRIH